MKLIQQLSAYLLGSTLLFAQAVYAADEPEHVSYCPAPSVLHKDPQTLTWYAADGWKSYDLSFVNTITRFVGAQWRGTNVGQIFCVYRGELETEFPVLLIFNVLAHTPQGGKWSGNLGGYQNCESANRKECPFRMRLEPKKDDFYEQAQKLKRNAPPSKTPGF